MHRTRNAAWGQLHRGFESLSLRHRSSSALSRQSVLRCAQLVGTSLCRMHKSGGPLAGDAVVVGAEQVNGGVGEAQRDRRADGEAFLAGQYGGDFTAIVQADAEYGFVSELFDKLDGSGQQALRINAQSMRTNAQ